MAYNEGNVNFCNHKFYGMLIVVRDLFLVQAGTSFEANGYGILYTGYVKPVNKKFNATNSNAGKCNERGSKGEVHSCALNAS